MKLRTSLERRIDRLGRQPGASIARCQIGAPVSDEDIDAVRSLAGQIPQALLALYREMDGLTLSWSWQRSPATWIGGDLNLLPLRQALLGASPLPDGQPCEGMLWNKDYPASTLRRLKPMRVLESVAGEPAFVCFVPRRRPLQLYLVEETSVRAIRSSPKETLELLVDHLGCHGLRETLTHADWRRRLLDGPCHIAMAGL